MPLPGSHCGFGQRSQTVVVGIDIRYWIWCFAMRYRSVLRVAYWGRFLTSHYWQRRGSF